MVSGDTVLRYKRHRDRGHHRYHAASAARKSGRTFAGAHGHGLMPMTGFIDPCLPQDTSERYANPVAALCSGFINDFAENGFVR